MKLSMWSMRPQLAVDLGTANTVVFRRGEGVVLFEPSVVAIDERTGDVHAVGSEARRMIGRTPSYISATRPLRDGVIADFAVTEQMLRHFIRKAAAGNVRSHADVMVCVPSGITQVERNAVTRAALAAGATHAFLIVYGVLAHAPELPTLVPATIAETVDLSQQLGWTGVAALLLLAYSQGGGTYTGLEAVSNNVNVLAEPRVHTGKLTMLYMAVSLAFTAAGIVLLYLLWDARPVPGQTLNAVAFGSIIQSFGWASPAFPHAASHA